jgi:hypothetical protein
MHPGTRRRCGLRGRFRLGRGRGRGHWREDNGWVDPNVGLAVEIEVWKLGEDKGGAVNGCEDRKRQSGECPLERRPYRPLAGKQNSLSAYSVPALFHGQKPFLMRLQERRITLSRVTRTMPDSKVNLSAAFHEKVARRFRAILHVHVWPFHGRSMLCFPQSYLHIL